MEHQVFFVDTYFRDFTYPGTKYCNELLIWAYPENLVEIGLVVEAVDELCTDICILGFGSSAMNLILMCSMNFMPISYQTDTEFIMVIHSYYPSILFWK